MNVIEIERDLKLLFSKDLINNRRRHVVFWYDANGDFMNEIKELAFENVRVWILTEHNLFATKYELETADPHSHFLIYANMAKPSPREDWLFLHYKNGMEFTTDRVTMVMRDLGVEDDRLRPVFQKYATFFNNQARKAAFQSYQVSFDTEEKVDLAVLATLTKTPFLSLDECVRALLKEEMKDRKPLWESIEKFGDVETFWQLMDQHYGYSLEERSLSSLLMFFMMTYLSEQLIDAELPTQWHPFISSHPMNAIVFMNQWMNHKEDRTVFHDLADRYATIVDIHSLMQDWEMETLLKTDLFRQFDEKIIVYLQDQLVHDLNQFGLYKDILTERRRLHWYEEFRLEYEAIENARWLLQFVQEKDGYILDQTAFDMFEAYATDYYRADLFYRKFYAAYDRVEHKESLYPLREKVERVYTNWYLSQLSIKWTSRLEKEVVPTWSIDGIVQQSQFYDTYVKPVISAGERVFVIISDGMRFDIAKELMDDLNKERRASTDLKAMQGILPSYTELGMASLLPHKAIYYEEDAVYVDKIRAQGLPNRNAILQEHVAESLAVTFQELMSKNRTELRKTFMGKKLIYIYHNKIDGRGDQATTEMEVFEAAEEAIEDIRRLVNQLVNNVSASNIFITADHGFLYERSRLEERDKLPKDAKKAISVKRRFMLSHQAIETEGTLTYSLNSLLNQNQSLYVTIPNGTTRFALQGAGANYVHGGAMPQEIAIPIITFKNDRSKRSENDIRHVDVKLTSPVRKVTNEVMYLEFFQTEKVEDKRHPLTLSLYFADKHGERLSNENLLIADSISTEPSARTFREKFVFRTKRYDENEQYFLILEEDTTQKIYEKIPFTIDLSSKFQ